MADSAICIGDYCGRLNVNDSCGFCPSGYRADNSSLCQLCEETPELYDWLYLGFMALLPLALNITFTFRTKVRDAMSNFREFSLYVVAVLENVIAAVASLLLFEPRGSPQLRVCRVRSIGDWYTLFYNPTSDFVNFDHCTQEAVYPLFSLVIVYYGLSIATTLLLKPLVFRFHLRWKHRHLIYYSLYVYPILLFVHFTCAGLIYYSFSYITLVGSLVLATYYYSKFSSDDVEGFRSLVKKSLHQPRHHVVVLIFWTMHFYGVVAITKLHSPHLWTPLLLIVPMPYLFYVVSFPFTKPSQLYLY